MSGPTGHWSDTEDDLLHELSHAAQVLYLRGLRRFVDAAGLVGLRRRLSTRGMIETLTVPAQRGRHQDDEVAPTRHTVRRALDALARAGLIEPLCDLGPLVFRLPHALPPESVSRMRAHMTAHMTTPMMAQPSDPTAPNDGAGFEPLEAGMRAHMSAHMTGAMMALQQSKASIGSFNSACRSLSARAIEDEPVSVIGDLCRRLRQDAGMREAAPHRPELIQALADGIAPDVIVATAIELRRARREFNLGYLLGTVRGRQRDAEVAGNQSGVGHAVGSGRRESVCERNERQDAELSAREQGAQLRVVR